LIAVGNIEDVEDFDKHKPALKRWNLGLNVVYAPDLCVHRVKYKDCRLPIAVIVSEIKKIATLKWLNVTEKDDKLYIFLTAIYYRSNKFEEKLKKICELYNILYNIDISLGFSDAAVNDVKILIEDYKRFDSNYLKSIKGVKRYNL
jgi:hypothetical protein